jgi:hypothetical protein
LAAKEKKGLRNSSIIGRSHPELLGEFSNPQRVRQYLDLTEKQDTEKYTAELKGIEKKLTELDAQFLSQLDGLLKRKVLTEKEFAKANETARTQKEELGNRKEELTTKLQQAQASEALIDRVPLEIQSFLEAFQSLEPRQQKAHLQTVLKTAHVYRDGKIELEFKE